MKKETVMELKEEYKAPHMSQEQIAVMKQKIEQAKQENEKMRKKQHRKIVIERFALTAAAVVAAFVILPNTSASIAHAMEKIPFLGQLVDVVTFRDYQYEDDRNFADVDIPELVIKDELVSQEQTEAEKELALEEELQAQETLKKTTEEINAEIKEISDKMIAEFEKNISQEGYQDIVIKSEVLNTTQDYFTLKLICYQGAGSGAEWNYFYTIDLATGERLTLSDLFVEGADFITPVSDSIKEQMQTQMQEDENKIYWLNSEVPEWDFQQITEETSFYLNEADNIVICFDEGEVAPMYMGTTSFEIPAEVLADIRK